MPHPPTEAPRSRALSVGLRCWVHSRHIYCIPCIFLPSLLSFVPSCAHSCSFAPVMILAPNVPIPSIPPIYLIYFQLPTPAVTISLSHHLSPHSLLPSLPARYLVITSLCVLNIGVYPFSCTWWKLARLCSWLKVPRLYNPRMRGSSFAKLLFSCHTSAFFPDVFKGISSSTFVF